MRRVEVTRRVGDKYRLRCIGRTIWKTVDGYSRLVDSIKACGWTGVRTDFIECECYGEWSPYCRPLTPGPGCPRGVAWPCPRCGGAVYGTPVQHRERKPS